MTPAFQRLACVPIILAACAGWPRAEGIPADRRQSGYAAMGSDSRTMQDNDRANPAMLWAGEGERLWNQPAGEAGRSCASCHGDARQSMAGVAARYPAFHTGTGAVRDLGGQIRACRSERQQASPWMLESRPLLAVETYIGLQSRGMPIAGASDPRLAASVDAGRALFFQRIGQLNLSCAGCHDDNWGRRLGASVIPQGHPTGYPIYRLEWQGVGSLQRRLRNCMSGVRAEPYPFGAREFVDLEVYLRQRAAGMPLETPGVRP